MFYKDLLRAEIKFLRPNSALKKLLVFASIPLIPIIFIFFAFLKDDGITLIEVIAGVMLFFGYTFAIPIIIFLLTWYVFIIMAYRIDRANEKSERRYSEDDFKE